ncbi:MAG TPA: hypothetical protein VGJ87_14595 [Roseiflexaceae bacterium]|jgi:hypothetical protein
MTVDLPTRREQVARKLTKLTEHIRAVEAAEAELAALDEQIAAKRAAAEAEQAAERRRQNEIASLHAEYARLADPPYRNRLEIADWARQVARSRARLIELGQADPGDLTLSAEAVDAPIREREQYLAEETRALLTRGWGVAEGADAEEELTDEEELIEE